MLRALILGFCFWGSVEGLSANLTLAYTANRQGETDPCGCQNPDIGGLGRMAERLLQLKQKGPVVFVDAGNAFFSVPKLSEGRKVFERSRAELIAEAYRQLGLKAYSPGERDFSAGADFFWRTLKKTGASVVSANLVGSGSGRKFEPFLVVEEPGLRIVVTGLTSFHNTSVPAGIQWQEPGEAFRRTWKTIQAQSPNRVVVLSHLGAQEDMNLAKEFPGIWIVGSHSMDFFTEPKKLGESFLFEVGIGGQRLGEVEVTSSGTGWSQAKLTELGEAYDKPNSVKKLLQEFKKRK